MPREVAEQPFRLVARSDRQGLVLRREIEQHDHALACHHVAAARGIGTPVFLHLGQVAVHRRGDIDRQRLDAELVDHELRVLQTLGGRRLVRHAHADHVLLAKRFDGEVRGERRIYAARDRHDALREAAAPDDFVLQKRDEPAAREIGVDGERVSFLNTAPHDMNCGLRIADCGLSRRSVRRRVELDGSRLPFPSSRFPFSEVLDKMRQIDLQISQQRRLRSRACDLCEIDVVGPHRLLEQRPA